MQTTPSEERPDEREPEEIRHEIAETRTELGDTVDALAYKADVKGRAKEKNAETKDQATSKVEEVWDKMSDVNPEEVRETPRRIAAGVRERPLASVGAALVGGIIVGLLLGRR
jgi:ElaB/YqjD/DUF883 family membrane-anchored ribosome-binding protein